MRKVVIVVFFILTVAKINAQTTEQKVAIYHPNADAKDQVQNALLAASKSNKQVLLMVGGNWCKWCRMFENFLHQDAQLDSALNANFIFEHINYSKENKNEAVLKQLEFPQRFGFPVFVILDAKGKRIHTQNSAYLEEGEGYSKEKVLEFFNQWRVAALDEKTYLK